MPNDARPGSTAVERAARLGRLATDALTAFVEGDAEPGDAGALVLASLAAEGDGPVPSIETVAEAWLGRYEPESGLGLHGGVGAVALGLGCAAPFSERLAAFHARIQRAILDRVARTRWPRPARDWFDYDLVTGPAGTLLVLCADRAVDPAELRPPAAHLAGLLRSSDMEGFRITGCRGDTLRGWNVDAVNLGLAHGVGGPIAALTAYVRRSGDAAAPEAETLAAAARWLLAQAHDDPLGLRTWAPRRRDDDLGHRPASRREAWCYGAPGIAWVLWDAGAALGLADLRAGAEDAFDRFAAGFDPGFHLDADPAERLAICHGAAGILLVADAFARHADSRSGERLARRVERLLEAELPEVPALAKADPSLLAGGCGVLAALLVRNGAGRGWLAALALR